MRTSLLFFFLLMGIVGVSQTRCFTADYLLEQTQADPAAANSLRNAEAFLKKSSSLKQVYDDAVIRIPVVVHVLYNAAQQNISDAQIRNGIEAMNRDFRRRNADTVNTPVRFQDLAADVRIEFALATADPKGKATSGIVRKQISRNGWLADDKLKRTSQGGDDAWDRTSYLNIWIVNLIGASGYSSAPGSAADVDGVVIQYSAFGTTNAGGPFNLGRTAVHEVGHWLGLKHIWGDTQCGDDGVADTPQQSFYTQGCPSDFRSTCSNGTLGDMYMNYMDYTNDACMNLFTDGQRSRMRALFSAGGPRASILQSKGLNQPWLQESPAVVAKTALYPNPARTQVTVEVEADGVGKTLRVFNSQGLLQKTILLQSTQQTINVAELKPGVYFVKGDDFLQKFMKL